MDKKARLCSRDLSFFGTGCCCYLSHFGDSAEGYIHPVCFPLLPFPASKPLTFRVSHFTVLTSNRKKGWQTSPSDMWSVSLNIYNYCVTIIPINTQLITITQLLLINYYHSPESIPLLLPSYLPSFFPPFFPPSDKFLLRIYYVGGTVLEETV